MPLFLFLAGLAFFLKDIIPWSKAQFSGVIRRRGHAQLDVRRADEPDRFRALAGKRLKGAGFGLLLMVAGVAWAIFNIVVNGAIADDNANLPAVS